MAGSQPYQRLERAIERLRTALLPQSFDPTGSYEKADEVHVRAASFRVLAHAEMESYVEDVTSELFEHAWVSWTASGTPSRVLLGLLAFSGRSHSLPPPSLKASGKVSLDVGRAIDLAQAAWRHAHRLNHGVKEENILRLLLPLGIGATEIDATLLSDLSSYGSARGEVAHTSASKVTQYIDPESEYKKVRQLVADLLKLDELILRGCNEIASLHTVIGSNPEK